MAIHRAFIRPLLHTANKFGCPYPLVPFISMIIHQLRQYYPFRPIGCTCNWMNPSIGWRFNAVEDAKLTAAVTTSWLLFHTARSHANRILMEHAGNRTIEHHFTMVFNCGRCSISSAEMSFHFVVRLLNRCCHRFALCQVSSMLCPLVVDVTSLFQQSGLIFSSFVQLNLFVLLLFRSSSS